MIIFFKKPDTKYPNNYSGIHLQNTTLKLSTILAFKMNQRIILYERNEVLEQSHHGLMQSL